MELALFRELAIGRSFRGSREIACLAWSLAIDAFLYRRGTLFGLRDVDDGLAIAAADGWT